jgi:hypothetical protein
MKWLCTHKDMGEVIVKLGSCNPDCFHDCHVDAIRKARLGEQVMVGEGKEELMYYRWSTKAPSPFWELLWMQRSFFLCFGICLLHLELLGNIKVRQFCYFFTPLH